MKRSPTLRQLAARDLVQLSGGRKIVIPRRLQMRHVCVAHDRRDHAPHRCQVWTRCPAVPTAREHPHRRNPLRKAADAGAQDIIPPSLSRVHHSKSGGEAEVESARTSPPLVVTRGADQPMTMPAMLDSRPSVRFLFGIHATSPPPRPVSGRWCVWLGKPGVRTVPWRVAADLLRVTSPVRQA